MTLGVGLLLEILKAEGFIGLLRKRVDLPAYVLPVLALVLTAILKRRPATPAIANGRDGAIKSVDRPTNPEHYRTDSVFGLDWQWDWGLRAGEFDSLIAVCPKCKYQLDLKPLKNPFAPHFRSCETTTKCDHCAFEITIHVPWDEITPRVTKEIHRKVRTGEYVRPGRGD